MAFPETAAINALSDALGISNPAENLTHKVRLLQLLQGAPRTVRKAAPAASPYQLATLQAIVLGDYKKASSILRATVRAGGVTGELAVQAYGATPITGQIAVAPNGDIVVLATDAITDIDVHYVPSQVEVVELTVDGLVGSELPIPAKYTARGVVSLLEAEVLAGTTLGKKIILVPGAAPATTKANLDVAKTKVQFNSATDAVTKARVKIGVAIVEA